MSKWVGVFSADAKPLRLGSMLRVRETCDTGIVTKFRGGGTPIQLVEISMGPTGERIELPPAFYEIHKRSQFSLFWGRVIKKFFGGK